MCPDDEVVGSGCRRQPAAARRSGPPDDPPGPYTFRGYYNSPQHNAEAFDAEGFYCSGDLISIDEDGYITVQGREKDQINRGGEKIAAEEIENLLLRHGGGYPRRAGQHRRQSAGREKLRLSGGDLAAALVAVRRFPARAAVAEFTTAGPRGVRCRAAA